MVTGCWALALSSGVAAQENIAPLGSAIFGAGGGLSGASDVTVDHFGPIGEINDGVSNPNLAPQGFTIDADGQLGANGNGVDTFAGGVTTNAFDFVGVLFAEPQYGVTSVRVQNFLANDGGWWGPTAAVAGGAPLSAADLAAPLVQVTFNGGVHWSSVAAQSSDYVAKYTGVVRGDGFPNATSGPLATFSFAQQNGINGIRLIGNGAGPADGNGFIGVNEFEVIGVPQELALEVNTTTGRVRIVNTVQTSIALDFYKVTSAAGSLDVSAAGWNSLQNPLSNPPGFPSGNGSGNGWEELGNLNDTLAAEAYLLGASTLAPGEAITLGELFDVGGAQDLALRYRAAGGALVDVAATYVAHDAADFDNDGDVDAGDLAAWKGAYGNGFTADADQDGDSDGADFLTWQRELGGSGGAAVAVPEPAALIPLGCSVAAFMPLHRRLRTRRQSRGMLGATYSLHRTNQSKFNAFLTISHFVARG
jgi:hypothetical protein